MYLRLYPKKNNSIFYAQGGSLNAAQGLINTGSNPIMQLMEGNYQGEIVLQFIVPAELSAKLSQYSYTAKLKLWDASNIPGFTQMNPKTYTCSINQDEFIEGSGYFFVGRDAVTGVSNYHYRDDLSNPWSSKVLRDTVITDKWHDDLEFNVGTLTEGINTLFVKPINPSMDETNQWAKYIFSRHTRTIFVPYLEIVIEDGIRDSKQNYICGEVNSGYLINSNNKNFTGTITCKLADDKKVFIKDVTVTNLGEGVYKYEDSISANYSGKFIYEQWFKDGVKIWEELVNVQSPDAIRTTGIIYEGQYFYPTSTYPHQSIMWGDKVNMLIIANARGGATIIRDYFEYRVVCDNGFEMIPWQKANNYRNDMWFNFDTSFFFPDINYEVQVRMKVNDVIFTSELVYKFKILYNGSTQLTNEFNASPYQSRDYQLKKLLKK